MKGVKNKPILIIYLALASFMYYSMLLETPSITIGSFNIMIQYLVGIAIVIMVAVCFLVTPDVPRLWLLGKYGIWVSLPILINLFVAMIIWVINLTAPNIMIRGLFYSVYQLIAVFVAISTVYLFGEQGIFVNFVALLIANSYTLVSTVIEFGLGTFISDFVTLVVSFASETSDAMVRMETTALAYPFGMYILYTLFYRKKKNVKDFLIIAISILFVLLGFKRSILGGLALGLAAGIALMLIPREIRSGIIYFAGWFMVIFAMVYVWMVRTGWYETIMESLGVDTSGRTIVFNNLQPYYTFSASYFGKGLGFITKMMQTGEMDLGIAVTDLHNDFLREYVEQGFWGFLVWLMSMFIWRIRGFRKRDLKLGVLLMINTAFYFILYFSENIYTHLYSNVTMCILIMGCMFEEQLAEEKRIETWL